MYDYLRKVGIFKDLKKESLEKIHNILEEREYLKGEDIFFEGELSQGVFIIKYGKIKIYKSSSYGKEHILHILSSGSVFAEVCIFSNSVYPASSKALEDSIVYIIDNKKLENLIMENGDISLEIIKLMSKRLIDISKQVETVALRDSLGKVSSLILRMLNENKIDIKNESIIKLDLSRQDMASMVSLTRESFTRSLIKLKEMGIIELDKDEIKIKDIDNLIKTLE